MDAKDLNELGINWLQDVSGEEVANARVPRAPLAQNVAAPSLRRLDSDASVKRANHSIERTQTERIGNVGEKSLDQVMRRQSRRHTLTSESRPRSEHHDRHELAVSDQLLDSVFEDWKSH